MTAACLLHIDLSRYCFYKLLLLLLLLLLSLVNEMLINLIYFMHGIS